MTYSPSYFPPNIFRNGNAYQETPLSPAPEGHDFSQISFFFLNIETGIEQNVIAWAKFRQSRDLKKLDGKKVAKVLGIPKLDDANNAGTKRGRHCTLILTEGDSAKALAISGLSVVGRDDYGVFPLKVRKYNFQLCFFFLIKPSCANFFLNLFWWRRTHNCFGKWLE